MPVSEWASVFERARGFQDGPTSEGVSLESCTEIREPDEGSGWRTRLVSDDLLGALAGDWPRDTLRERTQQEQRQQQQNSS